MNANKPVMKYRMGGSISAAVFENEANIAGRKARIFKVVVERRYRDANGVFQSSGSFGRNDIPLVQLALSKAYEFIVQQSSAGETDDGHADAGDDE